MAIVETLRNYETGILRLDTSTASMLEAAMSEHKGDVQENVKTLSRIVCKLIDKMALSTEERLELCGLYAWGIESRDDETL